jgi:serine/threonine protein kinase
MPGPELARVGRYSVLRRIGEGGMSVVYRAYDPELDRQVALKLLRANQAGDEDRARLVREARAMAKISHPNVAQVFDVGIAGHAVYVAMELVEGPTLGRWTSELARPWTEVVRMFLQAGRGLAAAHAVGLVHRDFKPDNVMVGPDGRPRVLDFGLARPAPIDTDDELLVDDDALLLADQEYEALSGEGEDRVSELILREPSGPSTANNFALQYDVTHTGMVSGTPAYMAPEQHRGEPGGAAADQFAFCVALWEALYRKRPFEGRSYFELSDAILTGKRIAVPKSTHVPTWLQRVVERGLAVEPRDRHPSIQSMLASIVFIFRIMHGPV